MSENLVDGLIANQIGLEVEEKADRWKTLTENEIDDHVDDLEESIREAIKKNKNEYNPFWTKVDNKNYWYEQRK